MQSNPVVGVKHMSLAEEGQETKATMIDDCAVDYGSRPAAFAKPTSMLTASGFGAADYALDVSGFVPTSLITDDGFGPIKLDASGICELVSSHCAATSLLTDDGFEPVVYPAGVPARIATGGPGGYQPEGCRSPGQNEVRPLIQMPFRAAELEVHAAKLIALQQERQQHMANCAAATLQIALLQQLQAHKKADCAAATTAERAPSDAKSSAAFSKAFAVLAGSPLAIPKVKAQAKAKKPGKDAATAKRHVDTEIVASTRENEAPRPKDVSTNTTVMLKHLPRAYTRDLLLDYLGSEGFEACYDFVYLPMDFGKCLGLGYAFINMISHEEALRIWKHFDGVTIPVPPTAPADIKHKPRACVVSWGEPMQGLKDNVERYRNSPVMHEHVAEQFKPLMFKGGVRTEFPAPTKKLHAPRLKHCSSRATATADFCMNPDLVTHLGIMDPELVTHLGFA